MHEAIEMGSHLMWETHHSCITRASLATQSFVLHLFPAYKLQSFVLLALCDGNRWQLYKRPAKLLCRDVITSYRFDIGRHWSREDNCTDSLSVCPRRFLHFCKELEHSRWYLKEAKWFIIFIMIFIIIDLASSSFSSTYHHYHHYHMIIVAVVVVDHKSVVKRFV